MTEILGKASLAATRMTCRRCQTENPPQAKFCLECAAPLAARCANCGTQLPASAKFCLECAHPVTGAIPGQLRFASPESYTPKHLAEKIRTSKAALEGERKQVTVLFADLKGSMELLADRDPEEARKLLDPVLERMMEAVHRYEGTCSVRARSARGGRGRARGGQVAPVLRVHPFAPNPGLAGPGIGLGVLTSTSITGSRGIGSSEGRSRAPCG